MHFGSDWELMKVCVIVQRRAFDGAAGACLMWPLAGAAEELRGGSAEPPALVPSTLPGPRLPPQT